MWTKHLQKVAATINGHGHRFKEAEVNITLTEKVLLNIMSKLLFEITATKSQIA